MQDVSAAEEAPAPTPAPEKPVEAAATSTAESILDEAQLKASAAADGQKVRATAPHRSLILLRGEPQRRAQRREQRSKVFLHRRQYSTSTLTLLCFDCRHN